MEEEEDGDDGDDGEDGGHEKNMRSHVKAVDGRRRRN